MAMLGHLGRFPVFLVSCGFVYPYKFTHNFDIFDKQCPNQNSKRKAVIQFSDSRPLVRFELGFTSPRAHFVQ